MPNTPKYDVAIIGSGIGGSTLAAVLARQGLSVIVFEGGQHPRFTIGGFLPVLPFREADDAAHLGDLLRRAGFPG